MDEIHYFLIYLIENFTLLCRRVLAIVMLGYTPKEYFFYNKID